MCIMPQHLMAETLPSKSTRHLSLSSKTETGAHRQGAISPSDSAFVCKWDDVDCAILFRQSVPSRYVSGDYRFRTSYGKHNPRKMVKVWAEKERRNLARLNAAGIRSPQPLQLRSHVLVMDFVGTDGVAAPRLKVHPPKLHKSHNTLSKTG